MYPLIIQYIAEDQLRERHERAARARLAREVRLRNAEDAGPGRGRRLPRLTLRAAGPSTRIRRSAALTPPAASLPR
jgi:hypothetical protein